ncbi:MAG: lytic transglycosylase domain-containing protein [Oscillospiraceae bacterium]|jgi:hypothetical protein|nr:lytic transglycosylase domain-containing protein [Oscillospiraceae bacterium]
MSTTISRVGEGYAELPTRDSNPYTASGFSDIFRASEQTDTVDLDKIFDTAAELYDVPASLLKAIGKVESGFNPNAVSAAGAQGVMQLMPATAEGLGVDNPLDPVQNIMGGARMVANLLERYDGDVTTALAAYNAGIGNVAKYGGVPPFGETQAFISRVLGYYEGGNVTAGSVKAMNTEQRTVNSLGSGSGSGSAGLSGINAQLFALNLLAKLESGDEET